MCRYSHCNQTNQKAKYMTKKQSAKNKPATKPTSKPTKKATVAEPTTAKKTAATKSAKREVTSSPTIQRTAVLTIHNLNQLIKEHFAQAVSGKLTATQFELLNAIVGFEGPPSQTQVTEKTGIDRTTTGDTLKRLLKSGYISRVRSPTDERVHLLTVTESGRKLHAVGVRAMAEVDAVVASTPGYQQALAWANKVVKASMFTEKPSASKPTTEKPEEPDEEDSTPANKSGHGDERDDEHTAV